jgi:hypothetical protein
MPKILTERDHDSLHAEWIHLDHSLVGSANNVWPASNRWVLFHFEGETFPGKRFRIGTCTPLDANASRFHFNMADNTMVAGPYPPTAWMPLTSVKRTRRY